MFTKNSFLLLVLLISACATGPRGIDVKTGSYAVPPEIESFSVITDQLPGFLTPMVVSSFGSALAEKGLQQVSAGGDAVVTLRLEQQTFSQGRVQDDFEERVEGGDETRFMAEIVVEFREAGQNAIFWQGSVQRLHSAKPGDYMHGGPAVKALVEAFRVMLADYPAAD